METAYWIPVGTFAEFLRIPRADRYAIRRELVRYTRPMREGGTVTGHHRTDKRI